MKEPMFYKTGDIAKFNNVSSDTVRYYDKHNLVRPSFSDTNGYRYYTLYEALKFNLVTALRETNISVENIQQFLNALTIENLIQTMDTQEEYLKIQQQEIQRKLTYLSIIKDTLSNQKSDEKIIHFTNFSFYMYEMKVKEEYGSLPNMKEACLDDEFWTRTSILGTVYKKQEELGSIVECPICFNYIGSDNKMIQSYNFKNAIRYRTFDIGMSIKNIWKEAQEFAEKKGLVIDTQCVKIFNILTKEDKPTTYQDIYFNCELDS
ncbi:MerR family transcriptional regulator [Lysinibacillus alkalisoli]|uniref:MerR family transcriptional regulator n=1 Tax=Lysinibacillus alkalisoli TaxID=1911548 RepID=A0A917G9J6_9BACI|nr:MerR family transcriptional regulator [Lysinibacillus alkalisoli]GGG31807.1 MerR family transcriptional regulator [Lysinibacillus alkalisoli]